MNAVLEKKLVEDFPTLYVKRLYPPGITRLYWGFDCGDGWEPLIRQLSEQLSMLPLGIQVVQVREQFGTLKFFYNLPRDTELTDDAWRVWNDIADACVKSVMQESARTCEECGRRGEIHSAIGKTLLQVTQEVSPKMDKWDEHA